MICKYCNGTGTSNICVNGTFKPCSACNGTGIEEEPQEQTNEEWLKSCNTEQLAEWLARITNAGYLLALRMKYHCDDVDAVREWLKEKHQMTKK